MAINLALSAGESSGDLLGAALASALQRHDPGLKLRGITGPHMRSAGVQSLAGINQLNVMGLTEVIRHLPRLIRFRRNLRQQIIHGGHRIFVGIDAPDFNLGLAKQLRRAGMPTAQMVAPSVWAWRRYRINTIARSVDLLMTLFPFEARHFVNTDLDVRYIGHPLADEMPINPDPAAARASLGLDAQRPVVALLPGSRASEIARHATLIVGTAKRLQKTDPQIQLILLLAEAQHERWFAQAAGVKPSEVGLNPIVALTRAGLTAADTAVAASGTVTLEALLCKTPMTIFYRLNASTYWLARQLVRSRWVGLPNVLANNDLVPERLQSEANPVNLCQDALHWLDDAQRRACFQQQALKIHQQLACSAADQAAIFLIDKFDLRPGLKP